MYGTTRLTILKHLDPTGQPARPGRSSMSNTSKLSKRWHQALMTDNAPFRVPLLPVSRTNPHPRAEPQQLQALSRRQFLSRIPRVIFRGSQSSSWKLSRKHKPVASSLVMGWFQGCFPEESQRFLDVRGYDLEPKFSYRVWRWRSLRRVRSHPILLRKAQTVGDISDGTMVESLEAGRNWSK